MTAPGVPPRARSNTNSVDSHRRHRRRSTNHFTRSSIRHRHRNRNPSHSDTFQSNNRSHPQPQRSRPHRCRCAAWWKEQVGCSARTLPPATQCFRTRRSRRECSRSAAAEATAATRLRLPCSTLYSFPTCARSVSRCPLFGWRAGGCMCVGGLMLGVPTVSFVHGVAVCCAVRCAVRYGALSLVHCVVGV